VRGAILDGIVEPLTDEPHVETHRVFYDVRRDERLVEVKVIGEKRGNVVVVRGEEYEL
jgi:hypothetical protein